MKSDLKLPESACYNGKLIWKVTDYKLKKKEALDGHTVSICSQPFTPAGVATALRSSLPERGRVWKGRTCRCTLWWCEESLTHCCSGRSGRGWPWCFWDQSGKKNHIVETFKADPNSSSFKRPDGRWTSGPAVLALWLIPLWRMPRTPTLRMTPFLKVAVGLNWPGGSLIIASGG